MTDDTILDANDNGEPGPATGDENDEVGDPFSVTYHDTVEEPANLRILKVYDDSMEPDIREGDRVVVDLSHQQPAAGGTFLLRLGDELVVRQVEAAHGDGPDARLRLIAANPDYAPCSPLAQDVRVIGKVVWYVTRLRLSVRYRPKKPAHYPSAGDLAMCSSPLDLLSDTISAALFRAAFVGLPMPRDRRPGLGSRRRDGRSGWWWTPAGVRAGVPQCASSPRS